MMAVKRKERKIRKEADAEDVYNRVKRIGKGSFGSVDLVQDKVALVCPVLSCAAADPALRSRIADPNPLWPAQGGNKHVMKAITLAGLGPNERMFALQEASVLEQMSHPNIIKYTDTFIARERLYIVMEYAEAGDLWRIMYKNPDGVEVWPEEIVLGFFLQMCLAVKFVHDRQILHRDIKPANMFLTKGGILKLGDFGIARVLERNQMARTQVGTPFYVAPEICHKLSYGKKADVWALGCVLFEMCAKEPPFNGRSVGDIQRKITGAPVPANPRLIHKYSPEMRKLVAQTLHKRPNQR